MASFDNNNDFFGTISVFGNQLAVTGDDDNGFDYFADLREDPSYSHDGSSLNNNITGNILNDNDYDLSKYLNTEDLESSTASQPFMNVSAQVMSAAASSFANSNKSSPPTRNANITPFAVLRSARDEANTTIKIASRASPLSSNKKSIKPKPTSGAANASNSSHQATNSTPINVARVTKSHNNAVSKSPSPVHSASPNNNSMSQYVKLKLQQKIRERMIQKGQVPPNPTSDELRMCGVEMMNNQDQLNLLDVNDLISSSPEAVPQFFSPQQHHRQMQQPQQMFYPARQVPRAINNHQQQQIQLQMQQQLQQLQQLQELQQVNLNSVLPQKTLQQRNSSQNGNFMNFLMSNDSLSQQQQFQQQQQQEFDMSFVDNGLNQAMSLFPEDYSMATQYNVINPNVFLNQRDPLLNQPTYSMSQFSLDPSSMCQPQTSMNPSRLSMNASNANLSASQDSVNQKIASAVNFDQFFADCISF